MSSKQAKRESRRARRAAAASSRARARLRRHVHTVIFAVGVILLLFLIGRTAYRSGFFRTLPGTPVPIQGNAHIATVDTPHPPYNSVPPTSGWHVATLVPWGVHKQPIANERQVHNLEDGGVLVQYNCDADKAPEKNSSNAKQASPSATCADLAALLEALASRYEYVIVAPYPDMPHRIALTAWGRILTLDSYDDAQITAFIKAYAGLDHHPRGF